jgi:hypothetical protein
VSLAIVHERDTAPAVPPALAEGETVQDNTPHATSRVATTHALATVVDEDGRWKVETDHELLRIGWSPEEALRRYYAARAEARCDDVADMLTQDAWAAAGADDRDAFVERCEASTDPDPDLARAPGPLSYEVVVGDRGSGGAGGRPVARLEVPGLQPEVGDDVRTETLTLVADGLTWKLDRDPERVAVGNLAYALAALTDEGHAPATNADVIVPRTFGPSIIFYEHEGEEASGRRDEAGFELGLIQAYERPSDRIDIALYAFADHDGAVAYARGMAERMNDDPLFDPDAPRVAAEIPYAAVSLCGSSTSCATADKALAVDVEGRYLVAVDVTAVQSDPPPVADLLAVASGTVDAVLARL